MAKSPPPPSPSPKAASSPAPSPASPANPTSNLISGYHHGGRKKSMIAPPRKESDSHGEVEVPAEKLWGAQTQRSLEHFSIGRDLMPREMITAYAILKKAAAAANHEIGGLDHERHKLIAQACDEILTGQYDDMFPLHVWMSGS